jgi:hypothetical protein
MYRNGVIRARAVREGKDPANTLYRVIRMEIE